jgi:hypothetical protein
VRRLVMAAVMGVVVGGLPSEAVAQGATPVVLRLPASTRAMALGGAFPVGTRDSDGIFYNAAFGDALRGFGTHVQRYGDAATLLSASGGAEWWGGTVAFGIRSIDYGFIGAGAVDEGELAERRLRVRGDEAGSSHAVSLAFARRVWRLRAALTGTYVVERRAGDRAEGGTVDAALAATIGFVSAGISARDIGPSFGSGALEADLPTRVALRAATRTAPVGPLDIGLAGGLEHRVHGGWTDAQAGAEVSWWPIVGRTFTARVGVRSYGGGDSPFTFGAGFTGDRIAIDWAWRELGTGGTHRVGLRYR